MKEFVIAVDVDVTICPTDLEWLSWLEKVCQSYYKVPTKGPINYDLTTYFKQELAYQGLTGFEFWKQENLYDKLYPVEGSVDALQALYDAGATLVAVSAHMGSHAASKRDWVYRHYPFVKDVILVDNASSKKYVRCDVIIEDRPENLIGFPDDVEKIIVNSPYLDHTTCGMWPYVHWSTIAHDIKYIMKERGVYK
jgi:5'(3')-deoxyribonucleotidase